jgi:beta-N-acetylhexosaminidase
MNWKELSLREKIGQTVCILADDATQEKEFGSLKAFLDKYPVGAIFTGAMAFLHPEIEVTAPKLMEQIANYQQNSKVPLLTVDDMESGPGLLLKGLPHFPHQMAVGAANSEELAYEYGKCLALGAKSVGVNWLLTPVADLSLNPFNPDVHVRAFSDNPDLAARLLAAMVRGMQENGIAATLKHFPGDGVDYREQHLVTSTNSLSAEKWMNTFGKVFQTAIDQGASAIMTGHITLPAFQQKTVDGLYLPASISDELVVDLLKDKMNFGGVVVTDALIMGGLKKWTKDTADSAVQCLMAGNDMMLWPDLEYFDRIEAAIKNGEMSEERLDDAVARIWKMKEKLGVFEPEKIAVAATPEEINDELTAMSRTVAEKAVTLMCDKKSMLPISADKYKKVLVVGVTPNKQYHEQLETLCSELRLRGFEVDLRHNVQYEADGWEDKYSQGYDLIIWALNRFPQRPFGGMDFFVDECFSIWGALCDRKEDTIVVSLASPYSYNEYFLQANVFINTFSYVKESQKALAKALVGEIPFNTFSPIKMKFTVQLPVFED